MGKPNPKIAIVDDDPDDLMFIEEALKVATSEFTIITFKHSTEFIDFLKSTTELPLLVVLDYNMPKLNAEDILIEMKSTERLSSITAFILSTGMNPALKERLLSLGAHCCIAKPSTSGDYKIVAEDIIELANTVKRKVEAEN